MQIENVVIVKPFLEHKCACNACACTNCRVNYVLSRFLDAMQTLRDNGMNPIAQPVRILPCPTESPPSPAKKPAASSLFSPPQAAEIMQPPPDMQWGHGSGQRPVRGVVRRRDAANQQIYDVSSSFTPFHFEQWPCLVHVGIAAGSSCMK